MPRGRPTKLTPKLQGVLVRQWEKGRTDARAAKAAGIAPSVLYYWLRIGRESANGVCSELLEERQYARERALSRAQRGILKALSTSPKKFNAARASHANYSLRIAARLDSERWASKRYKDTTKRVKYESDEPVEYTFCIKDAGE